MLGETRDGRSIKLGKTQAKIATQLQNDLAAIRTNPQPTTLVRDYYTLEYRRGRKTIALRASRRTKLGRSWWESGLSVILDALGEHVVQSPTPHGERVLRIKLTGNK